MTMRRGAAGEAVVTSFRLTWPLSRAATSLPSPVTAYTAMSPDAPFYVETCKGELAGMIRVRVPGYRVYDDVPKREAPALYHPAGALRREPFTLTFIPYCAWANREEGEMRVFVNRL